ncbi:MAG: magnesium and cobalt transport protein CorA [Ignavibacteria bacterium RIFOXYB2_FULL_35_12]|nr:MAG: magnesium and cobalt transport protein CorA [Ignavibacteria bacterium GWA2_36_19]OGU61318.1 MAG: magnesium and cobalt transport protein CorA [Ignavibacteria bacterium GWF2_35_20]OGU80225.1 MAG: magnesium and cobalt transport protein CorA [Ignavibacteria bacterium RIFOXYA2_FULL_35_9]OGU88471.1 MAG: magnesium and cobalt transport protein CorA [Ignavibacteria bacterium RIFOXYA12_FULL_35_25]OGU92442.1 MAG: magnesium and cobalt transport protein CorA [Ignavibacteria bacterium RIFOXYC12_FULL_
MAAKKYRSRKKDLSPGSSIFTGDKKVDKIAITIFNYDEHQFEEKKIESIDELKHLKERAKTLWVNFAGIHDASLIEKVCEIFGVHSLVIEDILNVNHSPKIEEHDNFLFLILKMIDFDKSKRDLNIEQISIILEKNYVITFQENIGDVFDVIRERIRTAKGRIRKVGADYLMYRLLDSIVDNYFITLEYVDDKIEFVEEKLLDSSDESFLKEIHNLRKDILKLRRAVYPMRDITYYLQRGENPLIQKATLLFTRDLNDHIANNIETIENYREIINGVLEVHLTNASHRMNRVIKLLTIISTIFIPLTFIVGIYGMNFNTQVSIFNMPELNWKYGYLFIMFIMLAIAISLVVIFKRKKWF